MTPCAVRGCDSPAPYLVTRDGTKRPACKPHADQAAALGYRVHRAPKPRVNVRPLADAAREREAADEAFRHALEAAHQAGATQAQLAAAAGVTRQAIQQRLKPRKEAKNAE